MGEDNKNLFGMTGQIISSGDEVGPMSQPLPKGAKTERQKRYSSLIKSASHKTIGPFEGFPKLRK